MRLLKSFFIALICCLGTFVCNSAVASCVGDEVDAGKYCMTSVSRNCPNGCFCTGQDTGVALDPGNKISEAAVQTWCAEIQKTCNPNAGVTTQTYYEDTYSYIQCGNSDSADIYRCPSEYPHSGKNSTSVYDCYKQCESPDGEVVGDPLYYQSQITCGKGKYIPAGTQDCEPCSAGEYCGGITIKQVDCGNDKGREDCPQGYACPDGKTKKKCTGNTYAGAGQSSCSTCDTKTHLIVTQTGTTVQIGCSDCGSGKYAFDKKCDDCKGADKYVKDGQCLSCPGIPSGAGAGAGYYKADASVVTSGEENCRYGITATNCENKYDSNKYAVIYKYNTKTLNYELDSGNPVNADVNSYVKDTKDGCEKCADGLYSDGGPISIQYCYTCGAGACLSGDKCKTCSAGFACPATNDGKVQECTITGTDYYGVKGCTKNTFSFEGAIECSTCGSNKRLNTDLFTSACSATSDKACTWGVENAVLDKTLQVCVAKKEQICFNETTDKCLWWPDDF